MEFKHLKEVLERYGDLLCTRYQTYAPEASGRLVQSARYEVKLGDRVYEVGLWLEDYWRYVEKGRKAGKFPPIDRIREWIRVKPVIPRPHNGRVPTEKQLAFLIARKIAREGTEGQGVLERALEDVTGEMMMSIKEAIIEDLKWDMREVLVMLGNTQ
jgi:hypothetical protein